MAYQDKLEYNLAPSGMENLGGWKDASKCGGERVSTLDDYDDKL